MRRDECGISRSFINGQRRTVVSPRIIDGAEIVLQRLIDLLGEDHLGNEAPRGADGIGESECCALKRLNGPKPAALLGDQSRLVPRSFLLEMPGPLRISCEDLDRRVLFIGDYVGVGPVNGHVDAATWHRLNDRRICFRGVNLDPLSCRLRQMLDNGPVLAQLLDRFFRGDDGERQNLGVFAFGGSQGLADPDEPKEHA